jgi:hypothetical protein
MRRRVEPGARPEGEHPPVLDAARLLELLRSEPLVVAHDGRMPRVTDSRQFMRWDKEVRASVRQLLIPAAAMSLGPLCESGSGP